MAAKTDVETKTVFLNTQNAHLSDLNESLSKQHPIQTNELEMSQKSTHRSEILHTDGIVSDEDLEKSKSALWLQQRSFEATGASAINNAITMESNKNQITELNQTRSDNLISKQNTLSEDIRRLQSSIAEWKKQYLIVAPIAGKISFSKIWSAKQAIAAGDEIVAFVPVGSAHAFAPTHQTIIGKAEMPILNSGKVKTGLSAQIRLDNFPFQQYGILEGTVQNISALPQNNSQKEVFYQVNIALNDSLVTSYKKQIPFQPEMQGTATIITENKRLIERLFNQVRDLIKNRS